MSRFPQLSFASGELAPALQARVDTAKFAQGAKTIRNGVVMRSGGVQNRAGTKWVGSVKRHDKASRLLPFEFQDDQTYVIELGHHYARIFKSGARVGYTPKTITGITGANPAVVTSASHGFSNNQLVYIDAVNGMVELNRKCYYVGSATTDTFRLLDEVTLTAVSSLMFAGYTSGGTATRVVELTTPYDSTHLKDVKMVQQGNKVILTHPFYRPYQITKTGLLDTDWSSSEVSLRPQVSAPIVNGVSGGPGGAGTGTLRNYQVTAVDLVTGEESLAGTGTGAPIVSSITSANPPVVTTVGAHGYTTGDRVRVQPSNTDHPLFGREFTITVTATDKFSLNGEDTTSNAISGSGICLKTSFRYQNGNPTSGSPNVLTWNYVAGREYNIYWEKGGVMGYVGSSSSDTFSDIGAEPDVSTTPPQAMNVFPVVSSSTPANSVQPSAVGSIQQRLAFGATPTEPEKVWLSRSGRPYNFSASNPIQDDDSIKFTFAGSKATVVRHILELDAPYVFTSAGVYALQGNEAGVVTPGVINPRLISPIGSGPLQPIQAARTILYQQKLGSVIRDLKASVENTTAGDLTLFSSHLFDGHTIVDWAYQEVPNSVVWAVRNDGVLLSMTFIPDQQIVAWTQHDTLGTFENVCVISEGNESVLYLVVKRTINGTVKRFIERMSSRQVPVSQDIRDMVFMDCAVSYDGRNTTSAGISMLNDFDEPYDETATRLELYSPGLFTAEDEYGGYFILSVLDSSGNTVDSVTFLTGGIMGGGNSRIKVIANKAIPNSIWGYTTYTWARAKKTITGLYHLEQQAVSILGDGHVAASPNNSQYDPIVVTNGAVTLPEASAVIQVGLPYISDLQTLDLDRAGMNAAGRKKLITRVTLHLENSRGFFVGPGEPDGDDPLENLNEHKIETDDYTSIPLTTDVVSVDLLPEWDSHGRVLIRQVDPLPISILAIMPEGSVTQGGG